MTEPSAYKTLESRFRRLAALGEAAGMLNWDASTLMPDGGAVDLFLNAQTHALGFYERAGFVVEGDEFLEAGIRHVRMTRST